jgi:hypothetical protein
LSFIQLVNPYVFFDFIQCGYYVDSMLGSTGLHLQGFFKGATTVRPASGVGDGVRLRLINTNQSPLAAFSCNCVCASAANPSNCLRISVATVYNQIRGWEGSSITVPASFAMSRHQARIIPVARHCRSQYPLLAMTIRQSKEAS